MPQSFRDSRKAVALKHSGKILESRPVAFTDNWAAHLVRGERVARSRTVPSKIILHNRATDAVMHAGAYLSCSAGYHAMLQVALYRNRGLPNEVCDEQNHNYHTSRHFWEERAGVLVSETYLTRNFILDQVDLWPRSNIGGWRDGTDCWAGYMMSNGEFNGPFYTLKLWSRVPARETGSDDVEIFAQYYFPNYADYEIASRALTDCRDVGGNMSLGQMIYDITGVAGPSENLAVLPTAGTEESPVPLDAPPVETALYAISPRNRVVLLGDVPPVAQLLRTDLPAGVVRPARWLHDYAAALRADYAQCVEHLGMFRFGGLKIDLYVDDAMRTTISCDGEWISMFDLPPNWHQVREALILNNFVPE